jgi:PAS domain S-box-containing protein
LYNVRNSIKTDVLSVASTNRLEQQEVHVGNTSSKRSNGYPFPGPRGRLQGDVKNGERLAVFEALNLPISLVNLQYTYRWVNSCYSAAHGKSAKEIIGKTVRALWGETFDKIIKGNLDRCFEGVEVRAEAWINYPALGPRYCEIVYSPCYPDGNSAVSAVVVAYDVTKRKELERQLKAHEEHLERLVQERTEELRKSEKTFRNIFENATEGIFQITPEGHFLSANPAFARIHGYDSLEDFVTNVVDIEQLHVEPERRHEYIVLLHKEGHVRDFEFKMYRKDGSVTWTSANARAIRDETGAVLCHEGTVQDISQRKRAEAQLLIQRNLALELARISSVDEALSLCLGTALQVSDMDCGAIHLRNPDTGDLEMAIHKGLSEKLANRFSLLKAHSEIWSLATQQRNVVFSLTEYVTDAVRPYVSKDGIRSAIMVPVFYKGQVIASMNLGSHKVDPARNHGWPTLELIAGQLGNILVRIQALEQLEKEIEMRRQAEKALEAEHLSLQEANTALKVLLKHREEGMTELEEKFVSNVKQLVLPHVEKLKQGRLEPLQATTVDSIEASLKEILSPFLNNLRGFNFTPRQLEIAILIKEGRTTKDIAELLHVSTEAIDLQRFLIRKKLGLNKEKADLRSCLLSLT